MRRELRVLEEADPETRRTIEGLLEGMDGSAQLHEGLSETDVRLVKAVYERIRDYIQGSVLISFLETRRQLKAVQRELADLRRQYDSDVKKSRDEAETSRKKLDRIAQLLENMQIPVEKGQDYGTQRRQYWARQEKTYDLVMRIARKIGISAAS